jgi:16S rRNA processing protein RimM
LTEPKPVWVGRLLRPHGVKGEIKLVPGEGCSGAWRRARRASIDGGKSWLAVEKVRPAGRFFLVKFRGVDTPEGARKLCGRDFFVPRDQLAPAGEGEYYLADLIGLKVVDGQGKLLGRLQDAFDNGAHEIYVILRGRREWLLPVYAGVVREVDLQRGEMVVEPPEGLLDE